MRARVIPVFIASLLLLTGCDQEPKEISVVQQYSGMQAKWEDVVLVYGFADNVENADVICGGHASAYPEREYRVVTRTMPMWKYERLKKQIEAP